MNVLIKSALIVDPDSPHHMKTRDIRVHEGVITEVSEILEPQEEDEIIETEGLMVSPGWTDLHVDFCDPGHEEKETIATGLNAAAAGGFARVAMLPSTQPVLESKADIEYVLGQARKSPVGLMPLGAATRGLQSKELTEMQDMQAAGAVGFTNDHQSHMDSDVLELAMRYASSVGSRLFYHAEDKSLSKGGKMHEGMISTRMGVKGMPSVSEEIALGKALRLAEFNDVPVHIMGVSTAESVEMIRKAKAEGVPVSCDVNVLNLVYTESDLSDYPTHLKVNPPIRTEEDRDALKQGVLDGTIDAISSNHRPVAVEGKQCEFDLAEFGAIGLQTTFNLCLKAFGELNIASWVSALHLGGQKALGLEPQPIEIGERACLSLFTAKGTYTLNQDSNQSLSENSPVWGERLPGKVIGLVNGRDYLLN